MDLNKHSVQDLGQSSLRKHTECIILSKFCKYNKLNSKTIEPAFTIEVSYLWIRRYQEWFCIVEYNFKGLLKSISIRFFHLEIKIPV